MKGMCIFTANRELISSLTAKYKLSHNSSFFKPIDNNETSLFGCFPHMQTGDKGKNQQEVS